MSAVVVLSPDELRALIREEVTAAIRSVTEPLDPSAPVTDEERSKMRKTLRKLGRR